MTGGSLIPWFLLAAVTAPMTGFISIGIFFLAKFLIDKNHASKIALASVEAIGKPDSVVQMPPANNAAIRKFFKEHSSTERNYDIFDNPFMYSGFVKVVADREFVTAVFKTNQGLAIASFLPPENYDNSLFSLLQKQNFYEDVVSRLQHASNE